MAYSKSKSTMTNRQKATMKKHASHHTKQHMTHMRKLMKEGKSFTTAHKSAMKKIGK